MLEKTNDTAIKQIAQRLFALRDIHDLSQQQVAEKLGVSLEAYEQFEAGTVDIPVSILHSAADLFEVDLTELLTGKAPHMRSYCLVRKDRGIKVDRYEGYDFQSLAYNFQHRSAEPLLVTVGTKDESQVKLVTHPGQEFNYVIEGKVEIFVGDSRMILEPGDSLYFDPKLPHAQRGVDGPAKFITIIL